MQRGDLQTTPLADLLSQLADATATGCVYLLPTGSRSDSEESMVGLRNGAIWNVTVPGAEESIATRLVASRRLSPTSLAEAREAQNTELSNWMLADLLIHLGLAEEAEVHALVMERALSDLADLSQWQAGSWRFRRRQRWGANLRSALPVDDALAAVARRRDEWRDLLPVIRGADGIVSLAAHPLTDSESDPAEQAEGEAVEMDADGFALLCTVDGEKTLAELGAAAGFTLLDTGRTIAKLVDAGLVQVTLDSALDTPELDALAAADEAGAAHIDANERHSLDAIAAALTFDDSWLTGSSAGNLVPVGAPWQAPRTSKGDPLTDALARVSAALSEAMTGQEEEAEVEAPEDEAAAIELEALSDPEPELELVAGIEPVAEVHMVEIVEPEVVEVVEEAPALEDVRADEPAEDPAEDVTEPTLLYLVENVVIEDVEEVALEEDEIVGEDVAIEEVVLEDLEDTALEDVAETADLNDLAELSAADSVDEIEATDDVLSIDEDADADGLAAFASLATEEDSFESADSVEFLDLPMIEIATEPVFEPMFVAEAEAEVVAEVDAVAEVVAEVEPEAATEPVFEPEFVTAAPIRPRSEASHHDMADASRLLSQLAGESVPTPAPAPVAPEPEPVAAEAAPVGYAPRPRRENGLADTAALLRELSSLGTETNASPAPVPNRPQPTPAPASGQHARKRKGLFGRS